MVEADLVDEHAARVDVEEAGDRALKPDGDVAQPDGSVAGVEQCADDDADGVREVDDPGAVGGALTHALGDPEDDGHGSQGLPEPAGAGRFLANASTSERNRLVGEPCRLAADAQLDEDERRPLGGAVEVVGDGQLSLIARR